MVGVNWRTILPSCPSFLTLYTTHQPWCSMQTTQRTSTAFHELRYIFSCVVCCCVDVNGTMVDSRYCRLVFKLGKVLCTGAAFNMLSLNINGLRTEQKRTTLGKLLFDLQIGVCILTETHLRSEDLDNLSIPSYQIVADCCRPVPMGDKIAGGVLILVHIDLVADELPKLTGLLPHIEHCSCMLYPTEDTATAMRVSGVYIPPPRGEGKSLLDA